MPLWRFRFSLWRAVCFARESSVTYSGLRAGEAMIVEGGHPSTQLWVLRDGALDLLRRDHLVTVMTTGELLGYASLLTRTAPAFSVRARVDRTLSFRGGLLGGRARRGGSQGVLHAAGSVGRRLTPAPLTGPSNCSAYSTSPRPLLDSVPVVARLAAHHQPVSLPQLPDHPPGLRGPDASQGSSRNLAHL